MSDALHLATAYAVLDPSGKVIDRILASDHALEMLDLEAVYPSCTLVADNENQHPLVAHLEVGQLAARPVPVAPKTLEEYMAAIEAGLIEPNIAKTEDSPPA
jgi:hypothetical protein